MSSKQRPDVDLVPVDPVTLEELVAAAIKDADPDDVTPALGAGWTPERLAWLRAYHEERRAGFAGGCDEETAAIRLAGRVVGASRLQRTHQPDPDELEWGIWLVKGVRGQGLGRVVLQLAAERAVEAGARRIVARTTAVNEPAVRLLRSVGATLGHGNDGHITAIVELTPPTAVDAGGL